MIAYVLLILLHSILLIFICNFLVEHIKNESKKSTGRQDNQPYYYKYTHISSGNISGTKTLTEYDNDEFLDIKQEILQVSDQDTITGQKHDKKYDLKLCTVDTRSDQISIRNKKLWTHKKNAIQESEQELEKKYKCEKCARTYKHKYHLTSHQRFVCGVSSQFTCTLCDKRFRLKSHMARHIDLVHKRTNSKASQTRHNCDKCFRSYLWIDSLNRHKRLYHAAIKPLFTCDYCSLKVKEKCILSKHIISQHVQ